MQQDEADADGREGRCELVVHATGAVSLGIGGGRGQPEHAPGSGELGVQVGGRRVAGREVIASLDEAWLGGCADEPVSR